jgi:hypothetical protein
MAARMRGTSSALDRHRREFGHGDAVVADERDASRAERLRDAIRQHLARCPLAGDTKRGIVANWVPRRGFEDAPQLIDVVVATMVEAGELEARHLPGGRQLYVRGPALLEPGASPPKD